MVLSEIRQFLFHDQSLIPGHTGLTAFHAAIFHESSVAQAETGTRANAVGTSIGTMTDTHEGICCILDVSTVTGALIRATANSIQTWLVTMRFANRGGLIVGPSRGTGTLFRSNALSTATTAAADWFANSEDILRVSLLAGTHIWTDTISVLASIAANGKALLVR